MASSKNLILVPVDFSEQSHIALSQSYNLARLTKAEITLIYVIDDGELTPLSFFLTSKKENKKSLEKNISEKLTKLASEAMKKSAGVKINAIVAYGKIYEEINKAAKKLKCSFIVMGTNGSTGIKRFIGSNALNVIRDAPCPVITIKGKKHRYGCKLILLPLDLTKETRQKVNKAIDLANHFGSAIRIVTVITTDDEFIVNKLRRQMSQVKHFIDERDIVCTTEMITGDDIPETIIEHAKKINADLIMIMTQDREIKWTERFIGSAAQEIINGTDIPVLTIHPEKVPSVITLTPFSY
ncbi:MAG TPA: universal stress protein [Bacteroidia bacterium]|nr:universal stress protein [Bacteroidia bacterium]